jgi:hypothetical protein
MRLDRLVTLGCFGPIARFIPRRGNRVPILMYHRVPMEDSCSGHPYYCTSTAVRDFSRQMRCLARNGYRSVNILEAYRHVHGPDSDEKLVAITFDDGYQDFYANAFPELQCHGFTATVFLPTAFIGGSRRYFKGAPCLTWGEVRELEAAGIEFGSHTVTHPQLLTTSAERMRAEIQESKRAIEENLGRSVQAFSYPYAFPETHRSFTAALQAMLQEAGYITGVSTVLGLVDRSHNPFFLNRLPLNSHDDEAFFNAKLCGGYDWLHSAQYVAKIRASSALLPQR